MSFFSIFYYFYFQFSKINGDKPNLNSKTLYLIAKIVSFFLRISWKTKLNETMINSSFLRLIKRKYNIFIKKSMICKWYLFYFLYIYINVSLLSQTFFLTYFSLPPQTKQKYQHTRKKWAKHDLLHQKVNC